MTITITVRKLHLAIAVLAVAVLAPATAALANHVFDDVPDAKFYAEPIDWALDNDITTGSPAGSDSFKPEDPVTRGESVTFLSRYHDNLAQPAIAANAADIAAMGTAMPFAVTASDDSNSLLTLTPTPYLTLSVTAPVDGHVTVNSTAHVFHLGGNDLVCVIVEATDIPPSVISISNVSAQVFRATGADIASLSGTRTFEIAAGATVEYVLACEEWADGGGIGPRNLTAIFTPAP